MDEQQLVQLKPELDRFLERYAPLLGRQEEKVPGTVSQTNRLAKSFDHPPPSQ